MIKKISIITVNYNDKIGLEKTILSVINQTFNDFEFIVIDGDSSDGSKQIIEKYSDKITHWISEKDTGVYNAMNKGIKIVKGEFIIFMNGGDTFFNEKVLEEVQAFLVDEYDIYYGNTCIIKTSSKRIKTYPKELNFSYFFTNTINHQSTFIRKKMFFDYFLYNEKFKIVSDWEFFIYTICSENRPYKYLEKTIANYDFTGISSIEKYRSLAHHEKQEVYNTYFPLFLEDYKNISQIKSKRIQQVLHIKKFKLTWKFLKIIINLLAVFSPKK